MAQLTDDQVDDVLREAEERLASRGSEITPTVVKKLQSGTQPQPQPAGTKEKLSVRQLQKSTAPPKVSTEPPLQ
jgi:DNA-binding NarL/FixJ family response regulator